MTRSAVSPGHERFRGLDDQVGQRDQQ